MIGTVNLINQIGYSKFLLKNYFDLIEIKKNCRLLEDKVNALTADKEQIQKDLVSFFSIIDFYFFVKNYELIYF